MIVGARFSLLAVMGTLLLLSLCWSSLPVLDEESYWAIARELNPLRPYDWELRWPPYTEQNSYIYAHPPGFLWWILNSASWCIVGAHKGNNQCDLWVSDGLCGGAAVLAEVPFAANLSAVLVGLRRCACALARGLMPDLPAMALASTAMLMWMKNEGRDPICSREHCLVVLLGSNILCCCCYLSPSFICQESSAMVAFLLGFLILFAVGELWLWLTYEELHLWVVLRRASEVASGAFGHRGVGLLMRASLALTSLVLFSLLLPGVLLARSLEQGWRWRLPMS